MMIDASAFLAILLEEPDGPEMAQRIASAKAPYTSPLAVYETCARLMKRARSLPMTRRTCCAN